MKKKLLSLITVVAMLCSIISVMSLTAFAAENYTQQYLGNGFTRLILEKSAFTANTAREFTVNIVKDGEYAVYVKNPDKTNTGFVATFSNGSETKAISNDSSATSGTYDYVRLGVSSSAAVASVPLTKGTWTLCVKALADISVPYIDIRSTVADIDGSKQAIYPMDVNSLTTNIGAAMYIQKYINESGYARAVGYTYHGDFTNSNLAETNSYGRAILLYYKRNAVYKINVKTAGEYKIVAKGRLRTAAANNSGSDWTGTISMSVGNNTPVSATAVYPTGSASSTWSDYIELESVVNLSEGENTITIANGSTEKINWYFNHITLEIPEAEEDEDEEGVYSLAKDEVVNYVKDARAVYPTSAYADYKTSIVSGYVKNGEALSDIPTPVSITWDSIPGAESYTLYVSTSNSFPAGNTITISNLTSTTHDVYNLLANSTYYWKVAGGETESTVNTFKTKDTVRYIWADGARNLRDIGGWNGIKQGLAYRGSELNINYVLTEDGVKTMHDDLGIKTDLDLRSSSQLMKDESGKPVSPIGSDVNLVNVAISNYTAAYSEAFLYKQVLQTFANSDNYPIYFHCAGGADRTGTVAFIIEALNGVSEEDLSIDYELTSFSNYGLRQRTDGGYYYASTVAKMKTYSGNTLKEKAENYAMETLGLTRAEVSNIQSMLSGNGVTFETTADICADSAAEIVLNDLGTNEIEYILFKGAPVEYTLSGNTISLHTKKSGTGEIVFADGTSIKFNAYSENDITFEDIANNQIKDHVTGDLKLIDGYVWTSSMPEIVSNTGKVTRPLFADAEVTLTAINDIGEVSITFTVKAKKRSITYMNAFGYPEFAKVDTDTAVLGTIAGGSNIAGWSVTGANVPTSINKENKLEVDFVNADVTTDKKAIPAVYFALDKPMTEKSIIEFDTYVDSSQSTATTLSLYVHAQAPDGTVVKKSILRFDAGGNSIRSVGWVHLNAIGGKHISGINGNTTSMRIEIDPLRMTTRYVGAVNATERPSGSLCTMYADILSSNTSTGTATVYYTTSPGSDKTRVTYVQGEAPVVNYKVLGFSLEGSAGKSSPYAIVDNMLVYTENDAPIQDATFVENNSSVSASVTFTGAVTGTVIIALYDGDNKLVGTKLQTLTGNKSLSTDVVFESAPAKAKIFFLDELGTLTPIYDSTVIEDTALEWK